MSGGQHHGEPPPLADENSTHVDLFCDCHAWTEPKILANGTDIAWPAGWTVGEVVAWRAAKDLERPLGHTIELLEILPTGEIELVTQDPDTIRRAKNAQINRQTTTFVYFDSEDGAEIKGKVTSTTQEETSFRFSVMPAKD